MTEPQRAVILDGIATDGGVHCETSTLDVLLRRVGVELSEPMLLGLGEGLGFVYRDSTRQPFPFLGGRTRPARIAATVTDRLGVPVRTHRTSSATVAWRVVRSELDAGNPVGLQLDSHHLEYFTSRQHFAGHVVAMYGYDDTTAHLVDTAQQGGAVTTSLASLERARCQPGPMNGRQLSFVIDAPTEPVPPLSDLIRSAVLANAATVVDPPIRNLGHRGIRHAATEVRTWLRRSDEPDRDLPQVATLMERAGTGGSLFRRLYADFLAEALHHVDEPGLRTAAASYRAITPLWSEVADLVSRAGVEHEQRCLDDASALLTELADRELTAMTALLTVGPPAREHHPVRPGTSLDRWR